MRLFYALTFDTLSIKRIGECRDFVAGYANKGRFTQRDNFHITLAFIGSTPAEQVSQFSALLALLPEPPKFVTAERLGAFHRKAEELVWLGIEREQSLMDLQSQLDQLLVASGFSTEPRAYIPHITLGRNIEMNESLADLAFTPIELQLRSVALMESKQEQGKLVYKVVDEILLP